jgi:predicted dehydrogenase
MAEEAGKAELVAVCDPVEESARRAGERFGVPNVLTDYRELLALPGLDAVSVCTPNVHHEPISLAALAAGIDVMCEKPLAMSYAGARRMAEAARQAGRKTAVNYRYRWVPAAGFVHDLIKRGELGEIYHVYANYFNGALADPTTPLRWRELRAEAGSGTLGDIGSHLIDLCRWWIGEFESVAGHLRTFTTERPLVGGGTGRVDVDDAASFFARLEGGIEGVFNATRYALGWNNHQRVEIYGSKGAVIYEIDRWDQGQDTVKLCLGRPQHLHVGFATATVPPSYLAGNPHRPMLDFVDAIRADREPSPSFADGLRNQEVLEAVELSAQEGRRVSLPLEVE